jgi:hypothetical protein
VGVVTVCLFASPAFAFHGYATGGDAGPGSGGNVTAVSQRRADQAVTSIACVYQSQWDGTSDTSLWLEEGTESGSECDVVSPWHWYWGYGVSGNFYFLGTRAVGPGPYHTFDFYRYAGAYYFYIDTTLLGPAATSSFAGDAAIVGLESYDAYTTVNLYQGVELQRTINGGPWASWVTTGLSARLDATMCGYFLGATTWRASEPAPC